MEKLYEGKAKIVYQAEDPDQVVQYFKNDATAFNALKKGSFEGKGEINNQISSYLFEQLEASGIATHYIKMLSANEMLCRKLEILKIEVVIRNVVAGSMAKRLGIKEGTKLDLPILEFFYKDDDLGDPLINEYYALSLKLATKDEIRQITHQAFEINELLQEIFAGHKITLVDFKLEFGRHNGRIYLGDEISPDTCRLWESETGRKLDKDRFREDLGGLVESYREVLNRINE